MRRYRLDKMLVAASQHALAIYDGAGTITVTTEDSIMRVAAPDIIHHLGLAEFTLLCSAEDVLFSMELGCTAWRALQLTSRILSLQGPFVATELGTFLYPDMQGVPGELGDEPPWVIFRDYAYKIMGGDLHCVDLNPRRHEIRRLLAPHLPSPLIETILTLLE